MVQFVPHVDRMAFTISKPVGPGCPNIADDVQLVQLGYHAMAINAATKPAMKPFAAAVALGAAYSGAPNDPLTIAIREHQKSRGGTQDGFISVVRGANERYDAKHGYQIIALVNLIFDMMPGDFPRLDKHRSCPPVLKARIISLMAR